MDRPIQYQRVSGDWVLPNSQRRPRYLSQSDSCVLILRSGDWVLQFDSLPRVTWLADWALIGNLGKQHRIE